MLAHDFGWPQLIAVLILAQRGLEELYSIRNTRALEARGGTEVGSSYYPVVLVAHLSWIAALFLMISPDAEVSPALGAIYLALQCVRYWVIASLGPYWTHRIITLHGAPTVERGPYKLIRHPNYCVTIIETFLLPMVFGAIALGVIMGAIWAAVLYYKIVLEDAALSKRRPSALLLISRAG